MSDIGERILRRTEDLAGARGTWESHWREIADYMWPDLSGTFQSSGYANTPGSKRTSKMFDSTAALALSRFASVFESMVTPRHSTWHRLITGNKDLHKIRRVRLWFEEATRVLFKLRYAPQSNFASQQQGVNMYLGAFGTGQMYTDELDVPGGGLRYKACHLGNTYFCENHQGIVDTAYRKFNFTARQAVQKWGADALPGSIVDAAAKKPDQEFVFIHAVFPREEYDPRKIDSKNMPWASVYVSDRDKKVVSEGGYLSFPYAVSRYVQMPGEVYGRSPGMLALPSVKTLNEEKKTVLKQGHRATDPVLLAHDDGVIDTFSLKPGSVNAGTINAQGKRLVDVLPTGNLSVGYQMMDQERQIINDIFLITLFQILVDTPQMTATEVLERAQEKGALLAPTFGRQQSEYLGPLIARELELAQRQGFLPPMPPELVEAEGEYEIMYDSPLSRAQRAEEASGLMRSLEIVRPYVEGTGDLAPLDWFDWDKITPEIAHINAVPESWMRGEDTVQQMREGRAQAAQEQKLIEAGPALAAMAKNEQQAG